METSFLYQAMIFLASAVICVPIAKKIGLGSVLGYLLAGIIIGPYAFSFIGAEGSDIMHFAEFGVVMMLFLVGLELEPETLWKMKEMIIGAGLSQVVISTLVFTALFIGFGYLWQSALAIGMALSMSSTAIVLQTLKEKGLMDSSGGKYSFSVLLLQDISIIPILAILPLLAVQEISSVNERQLIIDELPKWLQAASVLFSIALVGFAGRLIIIPLLRLTAKTQLRELFSASALLIVIAIAELMSAVGLSPALGTFIGGVVLANSEFRHELESDLEPFKGLLLGLFFIAVGSSINFNLLLINPIKIAIFVVLVLLVKFFVLFLIGKLIRLSTDQNFLFSFSLAQVGEFAFVLFSFIYQLGVLNSDDVDSFILVTTLTMAISPILILVNEKWIQPRFGTLEKVEIESDSIDEKQSVIIVGFSHFGSTIGRFLRANGVSATILDNDSDRVDSLRKMGFKVFYGNAKRIDLLKSAGADTAKLLIISIDSPLTNKEIVENVKKHFPNLEILVRAKNRFDAYELMDLGMLNIYRESIDSSIRMGVDALIKLGFRSYSATRAGQKFFQFDEDALKRLKEKRFDQKQYIFHVKEEIQNQEELLKLDRDSIQNDHDHSWDSEHLKESIKQEQLKK